MGFIVVYITHKNLKEAKRVANSLLSDKLIACVNYFPIESSYWWKGKITSAKEIVSLVKTRESNWKKLKDAVLRLHPYETPCIMKFKVTANESYELWIQSETNTPKIK